MTDTLREAALAYHREPTPGKLTITPTKPLTTQRDLSLAYSPGVAAACQAIVDDPNTARDYTIRGNLVAVITNGTAVLGLGNIGPLAAKPVMEGKAVLFKKFAGIDAVDIEIDANDVDRLVDVIAALEPSFGAINLEDIKAPECFEVEERLRARMNIPVFHDDQHGTAIIVAAAFLNWLRIANRSLDSVKLICSGAGAAALACLDLLVDIGLPVENIHVCDKVGVVYQGRVEEMDARKERYAKPTNARHIKDLIPGSDVFLGLSAPKIIDPEWLREMAPQPLILALANPTPEILPEEARAVRPDAIIATGRSDYPNQVNNVLCYPYIFRGALDVGATTINEAMKIACVQALADLATAEVSDIVSNTYRGEQLRFGPEYLIPKPFDPRLIVTLASAVAQAAMDSGVATRPILDMKAYRERLSQYVFKTGFVMRPVFLQAKQSPARLVYAEGEDHRVLHAAQTVVDEELARPILLGRPEIIERRIAKLSLRLVLGRDIDVVDPRSDKRYDEYAASYHRLMERRGVTQAMAKTVMRTNNTAIAALMLRKGDADAMICGVEGRYRHHMEDVVAVVGLKDGLRKPFALSVLTTPDAAYFICDTYVNDTPSVEDLAEMTVLAAQEVRRFGLTPRVALLSHSNFGSHDDECAHRMRLALAEINRRAPELEVDGEMHADAALSESVRHGIFPNSTLKGAANLLIMPNLAAANITFNMMKVIGDGIAIGPLLLGTNRPAHVLTPSATVRGIVNVSALASVDALNSGG